MIVFHMKKSMFALRMKSHLPSLNFKIFPIGLLVIKNAQNVSGVGIPVSWSHWRRCEIRSLVRFSAWLVGLPLRSNLPTCSWKYLTVRTGLTQDDSSISSTSWFMRKTWHLLSRLIPRKPPTAVREDQ